MFKKERISLTGWTIFGLCLALLGVATIIYGGLLYPINFLDRDFMSFVIGGLFLISIGVCLVSEAAPLFKIGFIWITACFSCLYLYGLEMDWMVKFMGFVPIAGFAVWLTTKMLK